MIGSARQSSNIRPPRRVCTVAAGEVGCRVDSARRTNQKRSTAQVLRGGSKNILPPRSRASGVHAAPYIVLYSCIVVLPAVADAEGSAAAD